MHPILSKNIKDSSAFHSIQPDPAIFIFGWGRDWVEEMVKSLETK